MPFEYYTILTNSYYVKKGLSSEIHLKEIEYDLPPTYTIDDIAQESLIFIKKGAGKVVDVGH